MAFHNPAEESNVYVWFVYAPQTIRNHTQVQVSGSINTDLINETYAGKNHKISIAWWTWSRFKIKQNNWLASARIYI